MGSPNVGAGPVKRFGRTETLVNERGKGMLWWVVYESLHEDDFKNGTRVAAFERHADAWAFMRAFDPPTGADRG